MGAVLILIGVGCMIAAIVGGGVKLQQLEVGAVTSLRRQALLGLFGFAVSAFGLAIDAGILLGPSAEQPALTNTVLNAGGAPDTNTLQASTNTTEPVNTNAVQAPASIAEPVHKNAEPTPADNSPPPPILVTPIMHGPAPPPPPPKTKAAAQPRAADPAPVIDISGVWVDDLGRKWTFSQAGANVGVSGGNPGNPWSGKGSLNGTQLRFAIWERAVDITDNCEGEADQAQIVFTCAAQGMTPLRSVLRRQ